MPRELSALEARVVGCLIEKQIATPDQYPLSLNALVNACNQRTSRDPVTSYDGDTVLAALESLRAKKLSMLIIPAGGRVNKHAHRISETLNPGRRELAVLCTLMLRGQQTSGEIHVRSGRMHQFSGLDEVEAVLERLMAFDPPLAVRLPKQPGTKEPRYAHLLSGPLAVCAPEIETEAPRREDRLSALEAEVARLREEVEDLKRRLTGPSE